MAFQQPCALRHGRSPSSTRLIAQTAVGALIQAASVQIIEAVLSIHTPGVPEVSMTRETPARAECEVRRTPQPVEKVVIGAVGSPKPHSNT